LDNLDLPLSKLIMKVCLDIVTRASIFKHALEELPSELFLLYLQVFPLHF